MAGSVEGNRSGAQGSGVAVGAGGGGGGDDDDDGSGDDSHSGGESDEDEYSDENEYDDESENENEYDDEYSDENDDENENDDECDDETPPPNEREDDESEDDETTPRPAATPTDEEHILAQNRLDVAAEQVQIRKAKEEREARRVLLVQKLEELERAASGGDTGGGGPDTEDERLTPALLNEAILTGFIPHRPDPNFDFEAIDLLQDYNAQDGGPANPFMAEATAQVAYLDAERGRVLKEGHEFRQRHLELGKTVVAEYMKAQHIPGNVFDIAASPVPSPLPPLISTLLPKKKAHASDPTKPVCAVPYCNSSRGVNRRKDPVDLCDGCSQNRKQHAGDDWEQVGYNESQPVVCAND
ncbi:hypothetical protein K438DRAFT_157357 [Mycena galopus ATCC 62051]|nr:hypothetical protein K438DRAFT_157357 [Mycena galopus ATCC 62051]